jgi:hypothetical protein
MIAVAANTRNFESATTPLNSARTAVNSSNGACEPIGGNIHASSMPVLNAESD